MADEIKQELGFDASKALETLGRLDQGFQSFEQRLQSSVQSMRGFNADAGKTVSTLIQMRAQAEATNRALSTLGTRRAQPLAETTAPTANFGAAQSQADAMNQALAGTSTQANAAAQAINNTGNAAQQAFVNGRRHASGFALSLETIVRVLGTQLIVRGLNQIRNAVEGSFQGFIEFDRNLRQIMTISDEPFSALAGSIRSMSDEFNAPILDVAGSKFQILQNGFQGAAESNDLLTASLKFGKVAVTDTTSAADLLAATLNAFRIEADQSETVAAKLFKTIERGRLVGSDLATSFGRVAPVAKEIGVSLDEALAAFSSITIGGVKASEAATQIRASMVAFLKPSEDMKKALRELGFETGEQLIRAEGYQGAMQKVIETTNGSKSAIAGLFPNVRALSGVLREVGTGADIFQKHLQEIREASSDLLNQKFDIRMSSDAQRVQADLNRLKNFFTVDLGKSLIETTKNFLGMTGGAETTILALKALAPSVGALTAVMATYSAAAGLASIRQHTLNQAMEGGARGAVLLKGALGALTAAFAAYSTGSAIADFIESRIDKDREELIKKAELEKEFARQQRDSLVNLGNLEADEQSKALNRKLAILRKGMFEQLDIAREQGDKLVATEKETLDRIIEARERNAADLRRRSQQARQSVVESEGRVETTQGRLADLQFNLRNRGWDTVTQSMASNRRAQELASQAAARLARAETPQDERGAEAAFQRAEAFAQQAISSAQTAGNVTAQLQAERTMQDILQQRIKAETEFQRIKNAQAEADAKAAAEEEARVSKLKLLSKDFLQSLSLFDKQGGLLDGRQLEENRQKAAQLLSEIREQAFKGGSFNLSDLLSLNNLESRLGQQVTQAEIKRLFVSDQAFSNLVDQIQGKVGDIPVTLRKIVPDPSALEGLSLAEQFQEAERQVSDVIDREKQLNESTQRRKTLESEIAKDIETHGQLLNQQRGIVESYVRNLQQFGSRFTNAPTLQERIGLKDLPDVEGKLTKLRATIAGALELPDIDTSQVEQLKRELVDLEENSPRFLSQDFMSALKELGILESVAQKRKEISELDERGSGADRLLNLDRINQMNKSLDVMADRFGDSATETSSINSNLDQTNSKLATAIQRATQFANQQERAAKAGSASPTGNAMGSFIVPRAMGGPMHFASGGHAKGTDNIHAMLSEGEFVARASATRRALPQLLAMNAGVQPAFRGNEYHDSITTGDIVINEAADAQTTARELMAQFRRLQHRRRIGRI